MAANMRTVDVVKFAKGLACNAAPIDLTLAFTSTDTSDRSLDADIADFMITGGNPTAVGMIPGPFCVPGLAPQSIISTTYTIEGQGTVTILWDSAGRVVRVLDVFGNEVQGIPLNETYSCLPAKSGDCPTSDPVSFCTTPAGGAELLCAQVQEALGEIVEKAGSETVCVKKVGGKTYRIC
jgi:hypothetical protein